MARIPLKWTGWLVLAPATLVIGLISVRVVMEGDIIRNLNSLGIEVNSKHKGLSWTEDEVGIALSVIHVGESAIEAGLRVGDVIFEVDGRPIEKKNYFQLHQLREAARLSVRRDGSNKMVELKYTGLYRRFGAWVSSHLSPPYHVVFARSSAAEPAVVSKEYAAGQ